MSQLLLVRFVADFGRIRDVSALFVATQEELDSVIGTEVDFGVGEYDLPVVIEDYHFKILEASPEVIDSLIAQVGSRVLAGEAPFDYLPKF